MSIDRSEIEKLAHLARIQVSEATVEEVTHSISEVLKLVDQLKSADTGDTPPMAHPMDALQRLRADVVTEENQRESFQAIAPASEDGLYLVPRVVE